MSEFKPLIFVKPYSDSVTKLKEIIAETAQEDGIEIYEIDDINEVCQILPTVGQSLTIFSNPKKCAAVLQPNRKVIQKLNSKIILLSSKSIPRKTLDKFSKIGLTECVVEPVPPKTLLYKVRLLIRSIVATGEEEQNDDEKKFSKDDESSSQNPSEKQRLEKGIISDEEKAIDYNLRGKIGGDLEISAEENDNEKGPGYKEGTINKEWQGKVNNQTLELEEEENKHKETEESESYIDSYLRGKKSSTTSIEFDEEENTKKNNDALSAEEDLYGENKKGTSFDLESDDEKSKKENDYKEKVDDKFYKGKVGSTTLELDADEDDDVDSSVYDQILSEEEKEKIKKESMLDLDSDDDGQKKYNEDEEDDFQENRKKKDEGFELEADDESSPRSTNSLILEKESKDKSQEEIDIEEAKKKRRENEAGMFSLEQDSEGEESNDDNEGEIDNYYRGNVTKTLELTEEEEIDARNANALSALDDDEEDIDNPDTSLDLESDDDNSKSKELDLEYGDEEGKSKKEEDLDIDYDEDTKKRKDNSLDLAFDDEEKAKKEDGEISGRDYSRNKDSKGLDLEFETENDEDEKKKNQNEERDYNRLKSSADLELDFDEDKKHSGHTEHISTKMDSRKGIKHQEYDWDISNKKDQTDKYDREKKAKSEIEISFREKVDLGEQTIDYRKLKSEFEAITINRQGTGKRKEGPKYYSEDSDKEFLKGVYTDEYGNVLDDIEELAKGKNEKEEKEEVFLPKSNGIEIAIKVLSLYADKKLKKEDIFSFITTNLLRKFGAHSFFFIYSSEKKDFPLSHAIESSAEFANEELITRFNELQEQKQEVWNEMKLPTWENEKYNTEENIFFFPFYEGANKLGYTICLFNNSFDGKNAKAMEVILETARGIYLEEFHKGGNSEKYDVKLNDNKEKIKAESKGIIKSVFGKLFGKAS